MKIRAYGLTQTGKGRRLNEDAFLIAPEIGLFAVADGVGGNYSGETAARLAVDEMRKYIAGRTGGASLAAQVKALPMLGAAIKEANTKVHRLGKTEERYRDMACTVVAGLLSRGELLVGHMGDSRLYLVRNGITEQLTADHTWVGEQVAQGSITPDEALTHKMRGAVTRAVGAEEGAEPDLARVGLRPGDYLLFCSDGLSDAVQRAEIGDAAARLGPKVRKMAEALADLAVRQGSSDDITVIVLHVLK